MHRLLLLPSIMCFPLIFLGWSCCQLQRSNCIEKLSMSLVKDLQQDFEWKWPKKLPPPKSKGIPKNKSFHFHLVKQRNCRRSNMKKIREQNTRTPPALFPLGFAIV